MALPKEYLAYLVPELVKRLEKSGKITWADKGPVVERVSKVLADDFAREDMLNQEVREHLEKFSDQIRRDALSYQELYKLVKKELMKKHKMVPMRPEDGTKISRDKAIDLSHQIAKGVIGLKAQVQIQGDPNDFRLEILTTLQAILREEYAMDQAVRAKIKSQKREIAEMTEEWDILFKRYYQEELRKLGVAPPAQPSQQAVSQRI